MSIVQIYPNQTYEILDTVAAASADTSVSDGVFTLGSFSCKTSALRKAVITASVAEQLQVTTLTPTAANSSTYEITITQYNPYTAQYFYFNYTYITAASGDTATTISTAFKAAVNAQTAAGALKIDATGAATIILTAATPASGTAGCPIFTVQINQTGGGLTQSTGTAGIAPVNTTASLAIQPGITVTNASYTSVELQYAPITGADNKDAITLNSVFTSYINQGDGDAATLIATVRYLLAGRTVSIGGPANPEFIAVP